MFKKYIITKKSKKFNSIRYKVVKKEKNGRLQNTEVYQGVEWRGEEIEEDSQENKKCKENEEQYINA